jgi:hypothetical protein
MLSERTRGDSGTLPELVKEEYAEEEHKQPTCCQSEQVENPWPNRPFNVKVVSPSAADMHSRGKGKTPRQVNSF